MADASDRIGMTEIGHITGLYAMWESYSPGLGPDHRQLRRRRGSAST